MSAWADADTPYTIVSAMWMNWNVVMVNDSTFSVNQPSDLSFRLGVYPQTIKVTDAYNLPLQGAIVNVTTLNGIIISLTTDSRGIAQFRVPVGLFSADVGYLGASIQIVSDSEGSHAYNVSFMLSYPLLATIVTVTAIAGVFLFMKFRKKPISGTQYFSDSD